MITTSPLRAAVAIRIAAAALAFGGAAASGAYIATTHALIFSISTHSSALDASQAARAAAKHAGAQPSHHRSPRLLAWRAPRLPKPVRRAPKVIRVTPPATSAASVAPAATTSTQTGAQPEPGDNGTEAGDG